mmetsp:Transcript_23029/g.58469  ORF Transcript_23029/g.58469 Transcript_23029/m.58469 type:complete len:258 (+) Transcript_23029:471-1244(+)
MNSARSIRCASPCARLPARNAAISSTTTHRSRSAWLKMAPCTCAKRMAANSLLASTCAHSASSRRSSRQAYPAARWARRPCTTCLRARTQSSSSRSSPGRWCFLRVLWTRRRTTTPRWRTRATTGCANGTTTSSPWAGRRQWRRPVCCRRWRRRSARRTRRVLPQSKGRARPSLSISRRACPWCAAGWRLSIWQETTGNRRRTRRPRRRASSTLPSTRVCSPSRNACARCPPRRASPTATLSSRTCSSDTSPRIRAC